MQPGDNSILARQWRWLVLAWWLVICTWLLIERQPQIHWFALGDTDDNMRIMQVRAWLAGQDWYDLRQYRLNPPEGANIHWSRLVDLPIAGLILLGRIFVDGPMAEKFAVAVAPLFPLGVVFGALALAARRLVAPAAAILGPLIFVCFVTAMSMFNPLRIDHHGWQLAMLCVMLAGLADPKPLRGGITVGIATSLSLVIGLELLPWLGIAGVGIVLRWILDLKQTARLRGYALSLGGGVAAGFLGFASNDNWVPRCDALTPAWVSVLTLAAASLVLISSLRLTKPPTRFVGAAIAGAVVLGFLALAWPDCVGRLEQVSPELQKNWLANISEARPLYTRSWPSIVSASAALIGLGGTLWMAWREMGTDRGAAWASIALMSLGSCVLTLWQARLAPAALTLSAPGAVALAWAVLPKLRESRSVLVRTFGVVAAFLLVSGLAVQFTAGLMPSGERKTTGQKMVNKANASCPTIPSLAPIARLPKTVIMTTVDLGPRLITLTHHSAIAGPYHRNGDDILAVQRVFRGTADEARAVMRERGATMLLICPDMSETTIYEAQNPKGFYMQLMQREVPAWLEPVPLPERSPFKLWRVVG
jgi:hypothetical protein